MNAEYFSGRLKELREAAGLTQGELAEKAGVSLRAISEWEQRRREPLWSAVIALAAALSVPTDTFLKPPAKRPPTGRGRPPKKPKRKGKGKQ